MSKRYRPLDRIGTFIQGKTTKYFVETTDALGAKPRYFGKDHHWETNIYEVYRTREEKEMIDFAKAVTTLHTTGDLRDVLLTHETACQELDAQNRPHKLHPVTRNFAPVNKEGKFI